MDTVKKWGTAILVLILLYVCNPITWMVWAHEIFR